MKTLLPIALLASMTSSLCAQRYEIAALPAPEQNSQHEPLVKVPSARPIDAAVAAVADVAASEPDIRPVDPVADAPFSVSLRLVRNGHLFAKLAANQGDKPFLGILLAAAAPNTIQLPSLPPLLKTDYVVATGIDASQGRGEQPVACAQRECNGGAAAASAVEHLTANR